MTRIAILDDYQGVALEMGDWEALSEGCEAVAFTVGYMKGLLTG